MKEFDFNIGRARFKLAIDESKINEEISITTTTETDYSTKEFLDIMFDLNCISSLYMYKNGNNIFRTLSIQVHKTQKILEIFAVFSLFCCFSRKNVNIPINEDNKSLFMDVANILLRHKLIQSVSATNFMLHVNF